MGRSKDHQGNNIGSVCFLFLFKAGCNFLSEPQTCSIDFFFTHACYSGLHATPFGPKSENIFSVINETRACKKRKK